MGTGGQGKFYFMGGVFFFKKKCLPPYPMINSGIALNVHTKTPDHLCNPGKVFNLVLEGVLFQPKSVNFSYFSRKTYVECVALRIFSWRNKEHIHLGSVVQRVISLTSSLVIKMLTVLVSTISNSQVFLLKNMSVVLVFAKATHIFSAKILAYMPYLMIKVLTIR